MLSLIVKIWLARLFAMCRYLQERPYKVSTLELEMVRDTALELVKNIDGIIKTRGE